MNKTDLLKTAILMSVKPEWLEKILNGEKTIEIRKTAPRCDLPIDVYLYCTKGNLELFKLANDEWIVAKGKDIEMLSEYSGKVVAKFTLGTVNEKRNIIEGLETLKLEDQILNIICHKDGGIEVRGYKNVEPFYNGKLATVCGSCLTQKELIAYGKGKQLYAWHIADLVVFDKPMDLKDFINPNDRYSDGHVGRLHRAPQSWQYVEVEG